MNWKDGANYQGQWEAGRAQGLGKFVYPTGDNYLGQWKDDKANGWGVLNKMNEENPADLNIVLKGEFKDNELHGFGTLEIKKDRSYYEGDFKNGIKHGWGIITWGDGSKLEGFWNNSKIDYCVSCAVLLG